MEIQEKLLRFKFHILFTLVFMGLAFSLLVFAPSFLTILAYFWPLFLSTAFFLVAVVFFGKTTSLPASDSHLDHHKAAAEDLLDYVAGQHQAVHQQPAETETEPEPEHEHERTPRSFNKTEPESSSSSQF